MHGFFISLSTLHLGPSSHNRKSLGRIAMFKYHTSRRNDSTVFDDEPLAISSSLLNVVNLGPVEWHHQGPASHGCVAPPEDIAFCPAVPDSPGAGSKLGPPMASVWGSSRWVSPAPIEASGWKLGDMPTDGEGGHTFTGSGVCIAIISYLFV